ncbi:MAG: hypothetical protein ACYTFI_25035, partial [Planctomycetota bacterium]
LETEFVETSRLPVWERLPRVLAFAESLKDMEEGRYPFPSRNDLGWAFGRQLALIGALTRRDAAMLGLAIELHRSARGEYPGELRALAPGLLSEIPKDPLTGKEFAYRRRADGEGFIVYSLGANLRDDAGEGDDVAWERAGGAARGAPGKP